MGVAARARRQLSRLHVAEARLRSDEKSSRLVSSMVYEVFLSELLLVSGPKRP